MKHVRVMKGDYPYVVDTGLFLTKIKTESVWYIRPETMKEYRKKFNPKLLYNDRYWDEEFKK